MEQRNWNHLEEQKLPGQEPAGADPADVRRSTARQPEGRWERSRGKETQRESGRGSEGHGRVFRLPPPGAKPGTIKPLNSTSFHPTACR